jgi:large-conductance mechanosensitive channel
MGNVVVVAVAVVVATAAASAEHVVVVGVVVEWIIVLGITITKADTTTVEDGMASASTAILEHFMLMIRL